MKGKSNKALENVILGSNINEMLNTALKGADELKIPYTYAQLYAAEREDRSRYRDIISEIGNVAIRFVNKFLDEKIKKDGLYVIQISEDDDRITRLQNGGSYPYNSIIRIRSFEITENNYNVEHFRDGSMDHENVMITFDNLRARFTFDTISINSKGLIEITSNKVKHGNNTYLSYFNEVSICKKGDIHISSIETKEQYLVERLEEATAKALSIEESLANLRLIKKYMKDNNLVTENLNVIKAKMILDYISTRDSEALEDEEGEESIVLTNIEELISIETN